MIFSLTYLILAILGLSVLIFIHEFGHYLMARRVGMRVETFSIGFGRPIFSWMHDGVRWQVCWLLFGGYVKIAGTEGETDQEIYNVPGGFFNKSPWDRIKVALMGPVFNLVLAFLIFALIWSWGGRQETFSKFTAKIGWVDPHSELYSLGVRPGDEISAYNERPYENSNDHLYAPTTQPEGLLVKGFKVDYDTGQKIPFEYNIVPYSLPGASDKEILTAGILKPANYIILSPKSPGTEPLMEASPLKNSGIKEGDRVYWIDGERVFSIAQLNHLLNDGKALLTIQRGDQRFLARVPRMLVQEFKLDPDFREELIDWQYEAQLNGTKIGQLYAIPYNLTNDAVVENTLKFIDKEKEQEIFQKHPFSNLDAPLKEGDKIVAVDGTPIKHSYQLLYQIQTHHVLVVVERDPALAEAVVWNDADRFFDHEVYADNLRKIIAAIGAQAPINQAGNLYLLNPIVPIKLGDWIAAAEQHTTVASEPEHTPAVTEKNEANDQLVLGMLLQDRKVQFNPSPIEQFWQVNDQIWRMLGALFSGSMNLRFMAGPVGIVKIVQEQWMLGFNDALYWLGVISLNLGILNLLPIPVLDGGTILFCLVEITCNRRLHPKVLEKAIIPFAILLIGIFLYITYYDLKNIFGGFFH